MLIIPAIDLLGGRAVRLVRGDYAAATDFGDPVSWLTKWREQNAELVHVVDLDGAREGKPTHLDMIHRLAEQTIPLQVGGGVRSFQDAESLLRAGAGRVVIGTAAAENIELVRRLVDSFGDRVVVAIDSEDGIVKTRGWVSDSKILAQDLARAMHKIGVARLLVTDISRDGTMTTPNYELLADMVVVGPAIIASGGVASVEAVTRLRDIGVESSIVGRALYDGAIALADLQAAANAY